LNFITIRNPAGNEYIFVDMNALLRILAGLLLPCICYGQALDKPVPLRKEQTRLTIYRIKSDLLKNRGFPMLVNGVSMATMWPASRFEMLLKPGWTELLIDTDPPVQLEVRLLAGQDNYLKLFVVEDSSGLRAGMALAEPSEALEYLAGNRLRKLGSYDPVKDSLDRIRTRLHLEGPDAFSLGAQLGFGPGFHGLEMVTLANGKTSKLSAGGGGHFGLTAAYRFTRNIEVQAEAGVQSGGLTPTVSNAEASFTRYVLAAAITYGIAFGKSFRFSIGPGIITSFEPSLDADLSKLQNGYKATFDYKPSQGYYVITGLDYYFKSWAIGMGIQYQYNEYTLNSAVVDGYRIPLNNSGLDPFRHLNGSGMFVLWNVKYFL